MTIAPPGETESTSIYAEDAGGERGWLMSSAPTRPTLMTATESVLEGDDRVVVMSTRRPVFANSFSFLLPLKVTGL